MESSSVVYLFLTSLGTKWLCEERGRGGMAEGEKNRGVQVKGSDEVPFHMESSRVGIQTL